MCVGDMECVGCDVCGECGGGGVMCVGSMVVV